MAKIAVVILNWNGKDLLEKFLPILLENTPKEIDIIVGDNRSTDDSISFVHENYPQIKTIINSENLGYAGGYNKVLERVESEYYVLLNSDIEVCPKWIEPVIDYLDQNPNVVAAQPKILSYFQKEYFEYAGAAGGFMDCLGYFFCRGRLFDTLEKDLNQYEDIRKIFWASGAAFFIRSKDFHQAGGFDSSLFAHMEEIDLCWRLQREKKEIAFVPGSKVYHMGGQTLNLQNSKKTYLNFRNNLIILYKNLEAPRRLSTLFLRFIMDFITWIYFLCTLKWKHALAINRAHYDFIRMHRGYEVQKKNPSELISIKTSNLSGYYGKSLVWAYYIRGKKKFPELF